MPTDDEMVVAVNGVPVSSMMDTGTHRTLLKFSEYRRIGSPAIRPIYHSLYGLGKSQVKPIVFGANLTVQGDQYKEEVYVIPDDTMDEKILGKGLMKQMDIRMIGGMLYIRKLEKNDEKKKEKDQEEEKKKEEDGEEKKNSDEDDRRTQRRRKNE